MKIYWYAPWPQDRPWVSVLLAALIARDTDEIVVQVLEAGAGPAEQVGGHVRVVADLPAVSGGHLGPYRWLQDRAGLVIRRAMRRNALIRRVRPDIVHLQLLNRFTDPWTMPRGYVVATIHDVLPHQRRLPWRAERLLLAKLYRRIDAIVVHHPSVGERMKAEFAVPGNRIHLIPLVIAPNVRPATRGEWSSPMVLFFGAFRRNKGIERLCEAIGLLAGAVNLRFHFAGRGDADIERIVEDLARCDRRVTADIGYVASDLKSTLFRGATLVVLPYTTFTSQSAVLGDAYAAGTPVLVADVGALGDSVRTDRTGWVLPSGSPDDIAQGIQSSLSDRISWERRAEHCAIVAAERSPESVASLYRGLYAKLYATRSGSN